MEEEKVLRKLHELNLTGVNSSFSSPHQRFQQDQHTRWDFFTFAGQRKYKLLCLIHSVLENIRDDPHCSYVNYSRDVIGTQSF